MLSALGTLTHDPSLAAITLMIRLAALAEAVGLRHAQQRAAQAAAARTATERLRSLTHPPTRSPQGGLAAPAHERWRSWQRWASQPSRMPGSRYRKATKRPRRTSRAHHPSAALQCRSDVGPPGSVQAAPPTHLSAAERRGHQGWLGGWEAGGGGRRFRLGTTRPASARLASASSVGGHGWQRQPLRIARPTSFVPAPCRVVRSS